VLGHLGWLFLGRERPVAPFRRTKVPYRIRHSGSDVVTFLPGVTWADWDQQGRLILARDGALHSARFQDGTLEAQPIRNLNEDQPAPVPSPAWATQW
jgi:hypothetical protein